MIASMEIYPTVLICGRLRLIANCGSCEVKLSVPSGVLRASPYYDCVAILTWRNFTTGHNLYLASLCYD